MILNKTIRDDSAWALIIILSFIIFIGSFRVRYPYLDHWMSFGDAANLIAAKNFVKLGFLKCYFLPIQYPQVSMPSGFYTHYPPFVPILIGFLLKLFNPVFNNSLIIFRIIFLLFSGLACWFWFLFLRKVINSPFISLIGLLFYITNPVFILNADCIDQYSLMEFFISLIMLCFVIFLEKKNKTIFIFLLSLLFLNILNSFEYVIYVFLFMFLYSLFFKKKIAFKYWIIMSLVVFSGFALHLIQNALMFKSIKAALLDLFSIAKHRIIPTSSELKYISFSFNYWFWNCFVRNLRFVAIDKIKIITIFIFLVIFLIRKTNDKKHINVIYGLKLLIIFFLCGLSWWILFQFHSIIHIYPATHMLLASALLSTMVFYLPIYFIRKLHFKPYRIFLRIVVIALIVLLSIQNILKSDLPLTKFNRLSKTLFINYSSTLSDLGYRLEKDEYIFTNYWNVRVMEYYSDRNCLYINAVEELKNQTVKHRYFLFFGGSKDLFDYLISKYRPIGEFVVQNTPFNSMMRLIIFEIY